jgi:hypothetical protein
LFWRISLGANKTAVSLMTSNNEIELICIVPQLNSPGDEFELRTRRTRVFGVRAQSDRSASI